MPDLDDFRLEAGSAKAEQQRSFDWLGTAGVVVALVAMAAAAYILWPREPSNVPGEVNLIAQLVALPLWGASALCAMGIGSLAVTRARRRGSRTAWGVAAILLALAPFAFLLGALVFAENR